MQFTDQFEFLGYVYYGNSLGAWASAIILFVLAIFFLHVLKGFLVKRMSNKAGLPITMGAGDFAVTFLTSVKMFFLIIVSLYLSSLLLALPQKTEAVITTITVVALLIQLAIWGNCFITFLIRRRTRLLSNQSVTSTVGAIGFVARVVLWSMVALLVLDNLGVDVTALVAGLGIGGIAVALALQNILGDLFASLSIVLDKPFEVGDFIIVGDKLGTVMYIGMKSTRVRSLSGEEIIFSNAELLKGQIRNYKKMIERRVVFKFGVIYQTSHEQLARIPRMVRNIIESQACTRFDRAHFNAFGDSSLDFEIVYYVLDADYNVYMDIQQAINLELFKRFEEEGIQFAYPTRTLYLHPQADEPKAESGKPALQDKDRTRVYPIP